MRDYTRDALERNTFYKDSEEVQFAEVIRQHLDAELKDVVSILKDSSNPYGVDLVIRYKSQLLPLKIEVEQADGWVKTTYPLSVVSGNPWRNASFLERKFESLTDAKTTLYVKYSVPMDKCYFMWKQTVWEYRQAHPDSLRIGANGTRNDRFIDVPWNEPKLRMGLDALGKCASTAIRRCIELGLAHE